MKKAFKIFGIGLLLLLIGLLAYIFLTSPKLPKNTGLIIDEVLSSEIPEFVKGETGYIKNGASKIWYESIMPIDTNMGAILLFMGISNDALGWPQGFLDKFVNSGYQVIRFDYRDTGLSDWGGNEEKNLYSLADLATDSKIILDSLNIDKANLLGISLGGMVAQEFAINFPNRTNTLTSIMSSGYILDAELPPISSSLAFDLIKTSIRYGIIPSEKNNIKLHIAARKILRGNAKYEIDIRGTSEQVLYNLRKRKGYNSKASSRHHEASYRSGSRYEKLRKLEMPVLIVHGESDPFIPIEHSKKLASILPKANTKWISNMGHDIPKEFIDTIYLEVDKMIPTVTKLSN